MPAIGGNPGDPPARADDHGPVDALADQAVGAADVVLALRGYRRRLQPQAGLLHRGRRFGADLVFGGAPLLQREVEAIELDLEAEDIRVEDGERRLEQLLTGLISLEDDDASRFGGHGARLARTDWCSGPPGTAR